MTFDIHRLDKSDGYDEEVDEALEQYVEELMECFIQSPEGQAHLARDPEMGFYIAQLILYGYRHLGVTLPQMALSHVEELVTEVFPRKISLASPDDADDAIPELVAFWEYLKREHHLFQADAILKFLRRIEPKFKGMMNDPAKFGMAKSFFMAGRQAGVDMNDKGEMDKFMMQYNARIMSQEPRFLPPLPAEHWEEVADAGSHSSPSRAAREKKKNLRKMARKSRKKNKKRRR